MLKKFRTRHIKTILWILLIVIVPSFVFWGISSFIRSRRENAVIIIGKHPLNSAELRKYLIMANIYYQIMMGENFYRSPNRQQLLENKAFQYILLLKKAKEDKIRASDEEVVNFIKKAFSINGKFDNEYYRRYVQGKWNLPPYIFEEYIRDMLTADKVFDKYTKNVKIDEKEVKELYKQENEKIKVSYLYIPYKDFVKEINVTEEEIKDYYRKHKNEFTTETEIRIKYLLFDKNKDTRLIAKMLKNVKDISKIDSIVKKLSLNAKITEFFDKNHPPKNIVWNKKANELAFSLPLNTISPLIEIKDKYILFEKIAEKKGKLKPIKDIKDKLEQAIKIKKAKAKAKELASDILKKLTSNQKGLKELAEKYGFSLNTTDYFTRNNPPGNLNIGLSVCMELFSLKEGTVYNNLAEDKNGFYIIRLDNFLPVDEARFRKEKEEYKNRLRAQKIFIERIKFLAQLEKETPIKRVIHY